MNTRVLLSAENLTVSFASGHGPWRRRVDAVKSVDIAVREGEVLALVGESGCGKTTLARALLRLVRPSAGRVMFDGQPLLELNARALRVARRDMQIIFQDTHASLDPRITVGGSIAEGLRIHRMGDQQTIEDRVLTLLAQVGLEAGHAHRYPHALSGGQRQRAGIARALALRPRFIVADEPVSSLDVSIQWQIIQLLRELKSSMGLTLLFITHNLGLIRHIADRVAVMYAGRIVEIADAQTLLEQPAHPYTRALLASVPRADPNAGWAPDVTADDSPAPAPDGAGCAYRSRCAWAENDCAARVPPLRELAGGQAAACWHINTMRS